MTKKSKAKQIVEEFGALRERRSNLENRWMTYFEKLHTYKKLTALQARDIALGIKSDIKVPRIYSHNETKKPRILNTFFSYDPIVKAYPYSEKSYDTFQLQEKVVNKFLRRELYLPMSLGLHQGMYAGTGFVTMYWDVEEFDSEVVEGPKFEYCDLFDTYVPDACLFIKDADATYRCFFKKRSYLEKQQEKGVYQNISAIKTLKDLKINSTYQRRMSILGMNVSDLNNKAGYNVTEKDEIVYCIEKTCKDGIYTAANDGTLIRESDPLVEGIIPLYSIRDYPNNEMFYGMGEVELLQDIPEYQSEVKNLRMDVLRRCAYPAALVDINANISEYELVSKPFQVIHTEDMQGYKEINKADVKRVLFEEETIAKQDEQDATAIYDWMKSGIAPRAETATMGLQMKEATMERINSMIFWTALDFFGTMSRDMSIIIKKNLDLKIYLTDSNEKILTVSTKELVGQCDWIASAFKTESVTDIAIRQQAIQIYNMFKQSPNINQYKFLQRMFAILDFKQYGDILVNDNVSNVMKLLGETPELAVLVMQAAKDPQALQTVQQILQKVTGPIQKPPQKSVGSDKGIPITSGTPAVTNMESGPVPSSTQRQVI